MKITRSQLKQIIKEELNELWPFGRKKEPKPVLSPEEREQAAKQKAMVDDFTREAEKAYNWLDCNGLYQAMETLRFNRAEEKRRGYQTTDGDKERYLLRWNTEMNVINRLLGQKRRKREPGC